MGDPYYLENQVPPPGANQVPPPGGYYGPPGGNQVPPPGCYYGPPGVYYPPNNPFPAAYHGAPPPAGGYHYAHLGVHYQNVGYAAPGGHFQGPRPAANPQVPHGNLQGGGPRTAQTAANFPPVRPAGNVHIGPLGGQGGPRPNGTGQEYARALLARYRDVSERRNELNAARQDILNQREQLTAQISDPNNAEGQMEFALHIEEIERLDQRFSYLVPKITHLDTVYHSIPNLLKSESLIPVSSIRDIHLASTVREHFGWRGQVILTGGGPDPWDACREAIVNAGLPTPQ